MPGWIDDSLLSGQDQQDLAGQASLGYPQEFALLLWQVSTPVNNNEPLNLFAQKLVSSSHPITNRDVLTLSSLSIDRHTVPEG